MRSILSTIAAVATWLFSGCGVSYDPYRLGPPVQLDELDVLEGDWGRCIDPDGDCAIELDRKSITINLPGTIHNLRPEQGQHTNAPRVLTEIEGDFSIQIKVGDVPVPAAATTSDTFSPYYGAGLIAWVNETTFVRIDRAALTDGIHPEKYLNFECFAAGRQTVGFPKVFDKDNVYLRLEKHGSRLEAYFSSNAKDWHSFPTVEFALPEKVSVGVCAVTTCNKPFKATFSNFAAHMTAAQ